MIQLEEALSNRLLGRYEIESPDGQKFVRVDAVTLFAVRQDYWELDFSHGKFTAHRVAISQPAGRTFHFGGLDLWLPITNSRYSHDKQYRW